MKIRFFSVFLAILILSICCRVSAARTEWKNAPSVSAQSAYVIEADRLETVFEKNADLRLPMASTTKIMTALVAIENCDTESIVKVPSEAVGIEGSSAYLRENDSVKMIDLLYSVMLESANDSAAAVAVTVGGSIEGFADLMNEKAKRLGLQNTHFTNPHGLDDPEHYTTARDLAKMTVAALDNDVFLKIVSTYSAELFTDSDGIARRAINHNKLLRSLDGAIGVKTGFTKKSGRCLVSAVERNGVKTVAVTLNDPNDWTDHRSLQEYAQGFYERVAIAPTGRIKYELPVIGGTSTRVRCSNTESISAVVKKGCKITTKIEADRFFPAPIRQGDALAKAVFYVRDEQIGSVALYAENDVEYKKEKISFFERLIEFLGRKKD